MFARFAHAAPAPSTDRFDSNRFPGLCALAFMLAVAGWNSQEARSAPAAGTGGSAASPAANAAASKPADRVILLIPILTGDASPQERRAAAAELLALGSDDAVKALSGILGLKNNNAAKLAVCEAVADSESPPISLAEPLLGLLQTHKDALIHDAAIAALYRFTAPSIVGLLHENLEREELQWLRTENAARSRELYGLLAKESDRVARLLTWLKAAQPIDRLTALEIVHSAMLATTPVPPAKEVLQQIRQMLRDPNEGVRRKLVIVLRDLQEKEDAARILGMLDHERSTVVLEEIFKALGRMGDPESIKACIKGLNNPDPVVAAGAADALGRLCRKVSGKTPPFTDGAIAALIARASSPAPDELRGQLVAAMADIGDPRSLPLLIAAAGPEEKVPQVRQAALIGIGQIGDPSQVDLVISRLSEDADPGVREAAAQALGLIGGRSDHLKPLMLRLTESSQPVQTKAWEAYRAIFARLPWQERLGILTTWTGKDKPSLARRIDLLTDLEIQAVSARHDPKELTEIRQELGDVLATSTEYALAAAAYARAIEGLTVNQADLRIPLAAKLMEAYLRIPAYDKAIGLASSAQSPQMLNSLSDKLLSHAIDLARTDPRAASECIDRFKKAVPALFGAPWGSRLDEVRRTATQPAVTKTAG
jgi:HEAT repeat protein